MQENNLTEKKKTLKWFLIQRFLITMFCIFICEELISLFCRVGILPVLIRILEYQQIEISSQGNILVFLIQMLLYFAAAILPDSAAGWAQSMLSNAMGNSFRISVNSPLYQGRWVGMLWIFLLGIFLILLGLSLLPYVVGALYYCHLVTKKVNELLEEEKEQQLAFDRRRNLLLSDIAHDIKTPITTICGYSKALSEGVVQETRRQEYLDAIYAKSMRMSDLITLLFEYVKLESEGFVLYKETGDIAELLRENAALLYADFEDKGMELQMDIPEEPVSYEMDKLQMGRAITNLLTNAVRYGKEGGKVLVRLREDVLTVADDGQKIEPEFAKHIFEPFSRADKARTTKGGSGLGLSITAKIVQMHGGELKLDCDFGEGYTKAFQVLLKKEAAE
ncbi:MAG: HAMP domain-containing histidine kinase [Lachnospiraceae bacterium]|nr:HAMP domain-containing histidine kinase [Lachnospiraceae bacterium]